MSAEQPGPPALDLTIVYRAASSIKPEPRNARTHSKTQVAEIAASIRQFGFSNPLLVDAEGVIIAGHGRLLAAKSLGLHSVPTITLPHLDEAQRRALRLADNKIALNAGWDRDLLRLELKELAALEIDFDLSLTGSRRVKSMFCWRREMILMTRQFLPFRCSPAHDAVTSGFAASIELVVATVVTRTFSVWSLATTRR